jgi:uncharacterized protein YxeA
MKKHYIVIILTILLVTGGLFYLYRSSRTISEGPYPLAPQPAAVGTVSVDKTKPTAPSNLTAVGAAGVALSWSASTDNVGVVGYNIIRTNVYIATTTSTTYTDTTGDVNKNYSYKIRAFDAAGNAALSTAVTAKSLTLSGEDRTAPTVPPNVGASVSGTKVTLTWGASTDNAGVAGYVISRGGVDVATTTGRTFADTTGVASQSYTYSVRAFDLARNTSAYSSSVTIQIPAAITWDCVISAPPATSGLDPFYKKYCLVGGIPVVSSAAVSDAALKNVASMMKAMLAKRPDAVQKLIGNRLKVAIIGKSEVTTDIPEYRNLYTQFPGTDWNTRTRGIGATSFIPVSSVGEENVTCLSSDPYKGESIFVHEFAHSFAALGVSPLDTTFNQKLADVYAAAKAKGLWSNTYAASSKEEYFAEGVQSFFGANLTATPTNGIHNNINGSAALKTYDPDLHALISAVYKTSWSWKCTP